MRIAYVCHWDLDSRDGVATKIDSQLARWRAAGHEVTAFSLTPGQTSPSDRDGIRAFPYASVGRRRATRELVRALSEWRPDVVYVRYDLFLPPVWAALGRFVTVLERNGNDRAEAKIRVARARLAALYNALNRRSMMRVANGVVCVTRELAEMTAHSAKHVPVEVIGNGVDLDAIRPLEPATTERPAAAFLGSMRQVWHGVDKLAWLAEALPDVDFEVVGYDEHWLREAIGGPIPPNMHAHGKLVRDEFEPVLARCVIAFGTLALHRKQMNEACPLKVREYLAFGLPVVIGYDDTDLTGIEPWWLLRVPNAEDNVRQNAERIRSFIADVRGRRVPRDEVADRIGAAAKEQRRLEFMERLAR